MRKHFIKLLYDLFIILISPPHSTIGFTDRTPIYLLPSQYFTVKLEENEVKVYEKEEEMEEVQESVVVEETEDRTGRGGCRCY